MMQWHLETGSVDFTEYCAKILGFRVDFDNGDTVIGVQGWKSTQEHHGLCFLGLVGMIDPSDNISTLEMKINYMKPVKGGEIFAEAKIIHKGFQSAIGDVEVRDENQKLISKGLATYAILKNDGGNLCLKH